MKRVKENMENRNIEGSIMNNTLQITKKSYGSVPKGKPILVTGKRRPTGVPTNIIFNGVDVTPRSLDPNIFTGGKERQISVFEIGLDRHGVDRKTSHSTSFSAFKTQSTVRFKTDFVDKLPTDFGSVIGGSTSIESTFQDFAQTPELSVEIEDSEKKSDSTHSELSEEEALKMTIKKFPSHVSLILSETETFFLLDIPSTTAERDTEEGL